MIDMVEQYFKGVLAAYLGANFTSGPITEWQIDIIKENISHYCEATIDHSQLSYQEKEEQKRQMKQSLEVYIQGVKGALPDRTGHFTEWCLSAEARPRPSGRVPKRDGSASGL